MQNLPKISIVTPNFNYGKYLEDTIKSVLDQGYPNLEYIVIDGGSTDNSVEIIRKYEDRISYWVSEKDAGLYDAVEKGLKIATGDIMGWVNSDDMLHKNALFILAEVFSQFDEVEWIEGMNSFFDERGRLAKVIPHSFKKDKYFFYLKDYITNPEGNAFIQQESTFWRRNLWERAGSFISQKYKLASDFELWMRFFQAGGRLCFLNTLLAGFRWRNDNMGGTVVNGKSYLMETESIIAGLDLSEEEKKAVSEINSIRRVNKLPVLRRFFKRNERSVRKKPLVINFNFAAQCFELKK